MKVALASALFSALTLLASCGGAPPADLHGVVVPAGVTADDPEALLTASVAALVARPEHTLDEVEVQHILVGITHKRLPKVQRTQEDARTKAAALLARIAQGEDFGALVSEATDDSAPGIYGMMATGAGDLERKVYPRQMMADAFGDVGWRLEVGEVGVAPYDPESSPFGFHIIKRTR